MSKKRGIHGLQLMVNAQTGQHFLTDLEELAHRVRPSFQVQPGCGTLTVDICQLVGQSVLKSRRTGTESYQS